MRCRVWVTICALAIFSSGLAGCSNHSSNLPPGATRSASFACQPVPQAGTREAKYVDLGGNIGGSCIPCTPGIDCQPGAGCLMDAARLPRSTGRAPADTRRAQLVTVGGGTCGTVVVGGTGGGGGGGVKPPPVCTIYGCLNAIACGTEDDAAVSAGEHILGAAVSGNEEWGSIIFRSATGGFYYTSGWTDHNAGSINFHDIQANSPVSYVAVAYQHVHPERYASDNDEIDQYTGTHFSGDPGDESVAVSQRVDAYVINGGTDSVFEWNGTNASLTAPDRKVGYALTWPTKC